MVVWAVVVGAFLGLFWAEFEGWGAILGGLLGAPAGLGLRAAVRAEIEAAAERRRLEQPAPATVVAPERAAAEPSAPPVVAPTVAAPAPAVPRPWVEPDWDRMRELAAAERAAASGDEEFDEVPLQARAAPAGPGPIETAFAAARAWAFGGNTVVRLGLVILFVGLSFLVRYAAQAGLFPIELRLAAVALAGAALLGVGFRTRVRRPGFGLALQGGGVGVIYLTLFAAVKLVPGFPVPAAFALMILVCAPGCALALLQRAQALAVTAFAGGYATPLLLSDGTGEVAGLFAYYTLLNLAVLFIAWRRSWRVLNLLGFFATFTLAGVWMAGGYERADFAVTQAFVAASVLIYLLAAVLFARRTPGRLGAVVDTTLLFGPALAGFGLEVALVGDRPFGSAFAAVGFAALYLGVATVATRRDAARFRVLHEAMLAIGLGFVTLAVPLALGAHWTSAAWALEGAGAFWIGMRQARRLPRAFGLALLGVAAILFLGAAEANVAPLPFANGAFLGAAIVAGGLLATAWWLRRPIEDGAARGSYGEFEAALARPLFLAGFVFQWIALIAEADRALPAATTRDGPARVFAFDTTTLLVMLAFVLSAAAWRAVGRRTGWSVATWPSYATLPVIAIAFLLLVERGRHLLFAPDWMVWAVAIGVHLLLLRLNDRDDADGSARPLLAATHVAGAWLGTAMLADALRLGVDRARLWDTSWAGVVFLASVTVVLVALTLWAGGALVGGARRWPLDRHAAAYGWIAAAPVAGLVYVGALATGLAASGETSPLPYLPLLNPVDLALALAIAALALWRRALVAADPPPSGAEALRGPGFPAALGALAFVCLDTAWFRFAHRWMGVAWNPDAMLGDSRVQTGLAIGWTLIALALMVRANRAGRRAVWLVGAALLGLTVAKLLLVDLGNSGGGARIVAFIGVGALMLVLGYLAPLPPRGQEEKA